MSTYFEYEIRLSGLDVDSRGICKASALLNHLQNAATLAAEDGGFSRETLIQRYGAFWMLARSWYRLSRPLKWEDRLTVRTWQILAFILAICSYNTTPLSTLTLARIALQKTSGICHLFYGITKRTGGQQLVAIATIISLQILFLMLIILVKRTQK